MEILAAIVTTCYNRRAFLPESVKSSLAQRCNFPFAIILCDDGSTDGTRELCAEYAAAQQNVNGQIYNDNAQIFDITDGVHRGVALNAYHCAKYALSLGAKFIIHLDSDDIFADSHYLARGVEYLQNNLDCVACYADYFTIDEHDTYASAVKKMADMGFAESSRACSYAKTDTTFEKLLSKNNTIAAGSVLYRATLMEPEFFEKFNQPFVAQDIPQWLYLSQFGYFAVSPAKLFAYRVQGESECHSADYAKIERFQKGCIDMRNHFVDYLLEKKSIDSQRAARLKRDVERLYHSKMLRISAKLAPKSYFKVVASALKRYPSLLCSGNLYRSIAVWVKNLF